MSTVQFGAFAPIIEALLAKRSVSEANVPTFLSPDYHIHTHDPFLFADMGVAMERLFRALRSNERIAVYADFDCDGIPGATVMHDFFKKIGYANFEIYIPHRDLEGYGIHTDALDELKGRNVSLMITVDVGTVAIEGIAYAKSLGIDTIVTDHHEIGDRMPDAVAVINPKRAPYPFGELCGTATAFKLVQAAIAHGKKIKYLPCMSIPEGWDRWLLDLVAIATVADMVPLIGENRVLARYGLLVLRKSPRPGIAALCRALRISQRDLTEDDIAFSIAPRVNAASRMDKPELGLALLSTKDVAVAEQTAETLERLNKERKGVVASIVKEIKKRLEHRADAAMIVLGDPDWKPALLGLVATSIVGEYGKAVCLWGRDGKGKLKGSCRSDGTVNVVELFGAAEHALIEYGGHKMSGGFSVSGESVHTLPEVLSACVEKARIPDVVMADAYDLDLAISAITWDFYDALSHLAPFGLGNAKPIFRFSDVTVVDVRQFGKTKEHLEVTIEDKEGGRARAISFFSTPASFTAPLVMGESTHIMACLEKSTFGRAPELRLRLVDSVNN